MVTAKRVVSFLETPNPRGLSSKQLLLENEDLKPVERQRRLWTAKSFAVFWIADGYNLNTWYIASAMLPALNWWQAWLCVWIGYSFTGIMVALGARVGAVYHVGFPVATRSSFGIWGSLWPVFNRAVMACVWTGVQSWIGGQCVVLLLRTLAPGYGSLSNGMPASSGTTTRDFVGFFIFILLHLPLVWIPVESLRHFFMVKAVIAPIAGIAYCAWACSRAGGLGSMLSEPAQSSGSAFGWKFVEAVMSSIANFATLICNSADFSRFASKPSDAILPQVIGIPFTFAITSLLGIFVASASRTIYGEPLWDPLALMGRMLDDEPYNAKFRAGIFFISFCFIICQLGTNLAANTVSAGSDLTALLPRFFNIRRGGYIAVIVALVMQPWRLLSSSSQFTLYLSAYSVFLSAIIGVQFCDYYIVRRGSLHVPDLYSFSKRGTYWYNAGIHWRAYVAYIAGIAPNAVGFGGAVGAAEVPLAATRIYQLNFFVGFGTSVLVYYVLARYVKPIPGLETSGWKEAKHYEPEDDVMEDSPTVIYSEPLGKSSGDSDDGKGA